MGQTDTTTDNRRTTPLLIGVPLVITVVPPNNHSGTLMSS